MFEIVSKAEPSFNGSFPQIDNLEYFPETVLLHIFSEVDDEDLLHLSDCSYRFEGIAKFAFKRRYASKSFVFDGDSKSRREMYTALFERSGDYVNVKAVEIKSIRNLDENHWIPKLLLKHTKQLKSLTFHSCRSIKVNEILSQHINITNLTIRFSEWNDRLAIPSYRNLQKLEMKSNDLRSLFDEDTILRALQNNQALEVLNLNSCHPTVPIDHIAMHLKHLKELNLIGYIGDGYEVPNQAMDVVADLLKHLESLELTIYSHQHIELLKRMSLTCKNLRKLTLNDHSFDETIASHGLIEAAAQFLMVESLELSLLENHNSINAFVEDLSNSHRLRHLKLIIVKLQPLNTFTLSSLNASSSLRTITIESWNELSFFSLLSLILSIAFFNEIIHSFNLF